MKKAGLYILVNFDLLSDKPELFESFDSEYEKTIDRSKNNEE